MKYAAKIDANQPTIVKALRDAGFSVHSLAACGGGVADLLVYGGGRLRLLEVKDPAKPPSKRALTPDQVLWHQKFPVTVVETVEDALRALS